MSSSETYTLTDIARECGVSRQSVYKRLQVDSELSQAVDRLTVQVDRRKVYTVDALKVLKQAFQATDCKPECKPECKPDASELTQQVDRLTQEVDTLTKERDSLQKLINQLREDHKAELNRMQAAYKDEAQRMQDLILSLQAQLDTERQHSREQSDRLAQLADQAQRLQLMQMQPPAQIPERKPSLWARLFGKRKHDFDIDGDQSDSPD